MDSLQADIDTRRWALAVNFLGVNEVGYESGNATIQSFSDLPWLQDTAAQDAWGRWVVDYRDVVIVNEQNVAVAVFNVTQYNLALPANFDSLRTLLGGFAGADNSSGAPDGQRARDGGDFHTAK